MADFSRRSLLIGGAAASATLVAAPGKVFAQANPLSLRDRKLFDLAKLQLDRAGTAIWRRDIVGIADFGVHSARERFHFVNMERGTVNSYLVAHGAGSDPEHDGWLNNFSNVHGSNATSEGAYVTWEWYVGRYGTSVRLGGLDPTNNNALPRYIVMHSAQYARKEHVAKWGRLGRSNGCFAMDPKDFDTALLQLSGGRLLYSGQLNLDAVTVDG